MRGTIAARFAVLTQRRAEHGSVDNLVQNGCQDGNGFMSRQKKSAEALCKSVKRTIIQVTSKS